MEVSGERLPKLLRVRDPASLNIVHADARQRIRRRHILDAMGNGLPSHQMDNLVDLSGQFLIYHAIRDD